MPRPESAKTEKEIIDQFLVSHAVRLPSSTVLAKSLLPSPEFYPHIPADPHRVVSRSAKIIIQASA